jgi:PST family polysaccharide transporter
LQLIQKIKDAVGRHKVLIENFSYLSALQFFNMSLAFITYPYLIKVLGADSYGLVIFAQVVTSYFIIFIDFGFRLSATKEISINKNSKEKLSEIISSVLQIKFLLWIVSFAILMCMVYFLEKFNNHILLFLFSFGICFDELLFPLWYFQGTEKMKYITIINLITRSIFLILIFILVKHQSDYVLVPLLNSIGALMGGVFGIYILFYKERIKFRVQSFQKMKYYLQESLPLFGSNAIMSIKDRFNVIFIGYFLGMTEVAIYDLGVKIMSVFMYPIGVVNDAIYPKVSREKNMGLMLNTSKLMFAVLLFGILLFQPVLPGLIEYLGFEIESALLPTRILLIAPLVMSFGHTLGPNCLIVFGKYKLFTIGIVLTTIFYLAMIGLGFLFNLTSYVITFSAVTTLVYLFELLYRSIVAKSLKLL